VKWESRVWEVDGSNCLKADDSQKSFLFTLKNPHKRPAEEIGVEGQTEAHGNLV
jgi:hypothetical protein